MSIVINPGSGPVANSTYEQARANMDVLVKDALGEQAGEAVITNDNIEDGGRFSFHIHFMGQSVDVDMPGIPLERVRYMGEKGQNIWHYPRLYVDGSSWVWEFAIPSVRERLIPSDEVDEDEDGDGEVTLER